jgi:hypothetical protein
MKGRIVAFQNAVSNNSKGIGKIGTSIGSAIHEIPSIGKNIGTGIGSAINEIPYVATDIVKGSISLPVNILTNIKINQNEFSLHIFEKQFRALGKTLDEYMHEIALDQGTTQPPATDNDPTIVRNEILTVFHKSKLNPEQLAALIMTNNIYIENESVGDWTRLQVQEVEEEIYNMRNEPGYIDKDKEDLRAPIEINRDPNEQSFQYTKKIKQHFY